MVAKRFFYVCAGLLCLALAYHLGAMSATAQSGVLDASEVSYSYGTIPGVVVNRMMYEAHGNPPDPFTLSLTASAPVPGTSPIVAMDAVGRGVILANGDYYLWHDGGWDLRGNMVGLATAATRSTWGSVKARYRPGTPTTPTDK
jgi:hypothetical protein